MQKAQILFLDDGNDCRSILGAAILSLLVKRSGIGHDLSIASASIGPIGKAADSAEISKVRHAILVKGINRVLGGT